MSIRATVIAVLLALIAALLFGVYYYHDAYSKADRDLTLAKDTITDMQTRQRDVAALDAKYTKELANAKSEIERLRTDLGNGTKRLRIAASCPKLPETTVSTGKPDATGPRLNDSAERDYLSLVERIRQSETMINGLQSYIRTQCQ